jgi:hypothetical protein
MQKQILLLGGLLIICISGFGQYKVNKNLYDYRTYSRQIGDPYNPSAMCFASVVIPGLGEILEGEAMKGVPLLLSSLTIIVVRRVSINQLEEQHSKQVQPYPNPTPNHQQLEEEMIKKQNTIRITSLALQIGLRVLSGIDAVRIAKVNNLAFRDKWKTTSNMKIEPFMINSSPATGGKAPVGLSFKFNF